MSDLKFNNVIAYCKGFYQKSDAPDYWKDLSRCLRVDGWLCTTKSEVTNWCAAYLGILAEKFPGRKSYTFAYVYDIIKDEKTTWETWYHHAPLDLDNYLIMAFVRIIRYELCHTDFSGGVIPNEQVLPINPAVDLDGSLWKSICEHYDRQDTEQLEKYYSDEIAGADE